MTTSKNTKTEHYICKKLKKAQLERKKKLEEKQNKTKAGKLK